MIDRFGIKTTRIARLGGEQIIVANKDLTDSRVRNYRRMTKRRVVFRLGVSYQTPAELLREIPGMVTYIFREIEGTTLDRVHFFSYGDFSLIYEIVYYVDGNDYMRYMDLQQRPTSGSSRSSGSARSSSPTRPRPCTWQRPEVGSQ